MGGSAIGGALARGGARRSRLAPDRARARLRAAAVDDAGHDACCAPATRATPRRRSPSTRRRARSARAGSSRTTGGKLAEAARAEGVPVIPLPGGFQPRAAVAYSLVVALEVAWLCGARRAAARRDRRRRRARSSRSSSSGDRTRPRTRSPRSWRAGCTARSRRSPAPGSTAPIAYRWKTQINENAKMPVLRRRAARARPQRDRRLGGSRRARPLQRRVPRRLRPASPHPAADRADARADRAPTRPSRTGSRQSARPALERLDLAGAARATWCRFTWRRLRGVDPGPVARARSTSRTALAES